LRTVAADLEEVVPRIVPPLPHPCRRTATLQPRSGRGRLIDDDPRVSPAMDAVMTADEETQSRCAICGRAIGPGGGRCRTEEGDVHEECYETGTARSLPASLMPQGELATCTHGWAVALAVRGKEHECVPPGNAHRTRVSVSPPRRG
jgi:hypothetical protein